MSVALLASLAFGIVSTSTARAIPASGSHETVDLWTTTTRPAAPAGLGYSARYHAAGDPQGDPPALRRLVIELPPGTRADTSVPGRCTASDMEIMLMGESACPPSSRVGSGQATAKMAGLGPQTFDTVLYNAPGQQLELVKSGDRVVAVVHTYVHGTTLDGPVPTCLSGGDPPSGCPFDQITLLANHLLTNVVTVGRGTRRRSYGTTPPACPRSHRWRSRIAFYYGDGSVDRVTVQTPCTGPKRPARHRRQRRPHPRNP